MSKTAENNAQDTNAPEIRKGLYGVVVDETKVSKVVPETNSLTYRGYPVQELARYCSFEEVAYLLWNGRLPKQESLVRFSAREKALRHLDRHLIDLITSMPKSCHPMDVLRTAVSFLGAQDAEAYTRDSEHVRRTALELMAKIPTIIALDIRRRRGEGYIEPSRKKGFAENFLWMVFGDGETSPAMDRADIEAFDKSLILYAEHSFNASTFAARVVTSTMSDTYSAIAAAIGALKGPLHGGANEAVMKNFLEIADPQRTEEWTKERLANKEKVMGFGHRVYKNGDSRVPTMEAAFRELCRKAWTDAVGRDVRGHGKDDVRQHVDPHPPEPRLPGWAGLPHPGIRYRILHAHLRHGAHRGMDRAHHRTKRKQPAHPPAVGIRGRGAAARSSEVVLDRQATNKNPRGKIGAAQSPSAKMR